MKVKEFLNPKSMLTPGIAGSFIMIIANTLWVQFALPPKWSALALSFLFLIPVVHAYSGIILEKTVYFVFNGLIVFAMAVNTNFAGSVLTNITHDRAAERVGESAVAAAQLLSLSTNAQADQAVQTKTVITTTTTLPDKKTNKPISETTVTTKSGKKTTVTEAEKKPSTSKEDRKFFQPWLN